MYMQIYIYLKILYKGNDQYLINMYMYFNNCMYLKRFFIYEFLMIYKNVKEKKIIFRILCILDLKMVNN